MTKEQWQAIQERDARWDGRIYCATRTTGVVCRPSCRTRLCNIKNCVVFSTLDEAMARGFRPCKRCRPDLPAFPGEKRALAEKAQRSIREHYQNKFSLKKLAEQLHVNESYLDRVFMEAFGLSPLTYCNQVRCEAAMELLTRLELSVTEVGFQVGYGSSSHLSRVFKSVVGIGPSAWRREWLAKLTRSDR